MNDLVDGILQYSRAGRLIRGKAEMDLNQIASEVISILAPPENIHITMQENFWKICESDNGPGKEKPIALLLY